MLEPGSAEELASALASANGSGTAIIARGGGTKSDWGNPPARGGTILSTRRLNRIIEHAWADLTVTVEAGCAVACLQATLSQRGQRLALDPLWPERATIGGILATNDSGALRLRYGGLRDLIIGVTLALPDGTLASSGGKVVKNVAGYDLPKLATGSLGTLGIITQAVFRLHPLPMNRRTLLLAPGGLGEMQRIVHAIQNSQLAHSALQMRLASGSAPEIDVLIEGTEAGIAAQESRVHEIAGGTLVSEGSGELWAARQELWPAEGAVLKLSMPPAEIARTAESMERLGPGAWSAVIQATGLGHVRWNGSRDGILALRDQLERGDGSLVVLRQPWGEPVEAWGSPGDALSLMRALKQQFDPNGILNPGRFLGGI
jgi:glycolate oxidase FAD binding subunit